MRILVVGGTRFVGHAIVKAALAHGHSVTLLHRTPSELFSEATHVVTDRDEDLSLLAGRKWDGTIDTCAYRSTQVVRLADVLGERAGHYVLISTIAAYREPPGYGGDESTLELLPPAGPAEPSTPSNYGQRKVACERAALERFGSSRVAIVRPTWVVGPREPSGRLEWWIERFGRQGEVVLPGPARAPFQYIDSRDLAEWVVRLLTLRVTGDFIAAQPPRPFGDVVADIGLALSSQARLVELDPKFLAAHGITPSNFPYWSGGSFDSGLTLSSERAAATGLRHRAIGQTVLSVVRRMPRSDSPSQFWISEAREAELLRLWAADR